MTIDQTSLAIADRRRRQLTAALIVDVAAFVLAVVALVGSMLSALAPALGTLGTGVALALSRQSWAGARQVWSDGADPARLRQLTRRSARPALPVLIVSCGVIIGAGVPSVARVFASSPTVGNAAWTDGVLLVSLSLYLLASVGAVLYPLRVQR